MSSASGVVVEPEVVQTFNELKLGKGSIKFIVFKLSDDLKNVVVDQASPETSYSAFMDVLENAKSKNRQGKEVDGPRYAVYDFEYELANGEGTRNKIGFISWNPDSAPVMLKTVYASSKAALVNALNGISEETQATDRDELSWDTVLAKVSGGKARKGEPGA